MHRTCLCMCLCALCVHSDIQSINLTGKKNMQTIWGQQLLWLIFFIFFLFWTSITAYILLLKYLRPFQLRLLKCGRCLWPLRRESQRWRHYEWADDKKQTDYEISPSFYFFWFGWVHFSISFICFSSFSLFFFSLSFSLEHELLREGEGCVGVRGVTF